jgi:rhamnulokinase
MGNYLAIDINQTEGYHTIGYLTNGKIHLEKVHSFQIKQNEKDRENVWNFDEIFNEIIYGIKKCREIGRLPIFVSVSAWASDFVLLDAKNKVILVTASCPDIIDQLKIIKEKYQDCRDNADSFLTIPDYLNYLLTGNKRCEYTNLYHSQLVRLDAKDWDEEQLGATGYPRSIFPPISQPGTVLGNLTMEITEAIDYDCIIMQSASREASASIITNFGDEFKNQKDLGISHAAIGNLLLLMMISHELADLKEARDYLRNTFRTMHPEENQHENQP